MRTWREKLRMFKAVEEKELWLLEAKGIVVAVILGVIVGLIILWR